MDLIAKEYLSEFIKHIKIYKQFIRNSLIASMEYRTDFFMKFLVQIGCLLFKLTFIFITYRTGLVIAGMGPDAILLYTGTYSIMCGVNDFLFLQNLFSLPNLIRKGDLDIYITKPISLQFMATMRYVDFAMPIPSIGGGIVMVVLAWQRLGLALNFLNLTGYILCLIGSTILIYSVMLIPIMLSFLFVRIDSIYSFIFGLWDMNAMPMKTYNRFIAGMGVYVLPVFVITNFPSMFLLKQMGATDIIWGALVPFVFLMILRALWNVSVRHYKSASS